MSTEQLTAPVDGVKRPARARKRRRRRKDRVGVLLSALAQFFASRRGDALLVLLLFLGALAIRWPYLLRLPHFTDETVEIHWALAIARGEIFPLTASDRYYGPLHPYLVAAAPPALRAVDLAAARDRDGFRRADRRADLSTRARARRRVAGLIGAGLLATAPQHIIVNSHIAWQNSTTPFYATLTFLALTLYLNAERGTGNAGIKARG
jgi:hypothetical protein